MIFMANIEKARQHYQKAREIEFDSTRFFREFQDKVRQEIADIRLDRDLSEQGKFRKTEELKKKRGLEFLQKAHVRKKEYLAELAKAQKEADAIVFAALKKPDATKLERFEKDLRALKTELLLTHRADLAFRKLDEFVKRIDDAYLADMVREQFQDLAMPIIAVAGGEAAKYRLQLAQTFDKLKGDFESEAVKEARQILETSKTLTEHARLFDPIVEQKAVELFGHEHGQFVNRTDEYFTKNEHEKPADYVDPAQEYKKYEWGSAEYMRAKYGL
jgi:hypothetical protein